MCQTKTRNFKCMGRSRVRRGKSDFYINKMWKKCQMILIYQWNERRSSQGASLGQSRALCTFPLCSGTRLEGAPCQLSVSRGLHLPECNSATTLGLEDQHSGRLASYWYKKIAIMWLHSVLKTTAFYNYNQDVFCGNRCYLFCTSILHDINVKRGQKKMEKKKLKNECKGGKKAGSVSVIFQSGIFACLKG